MVLDQDICYQALQTRDERFDGRFFTGVASTGIYCRPVCPARTPKREHCSFYSCAAAAEEAGFRPCRRCRPETAPGSPAWSGTSATVTRALRLIEEGALDDGGVTRLASRLGVGERHLRRLFLEQLGAPPRAVAQTRRVHFAKLLIEESELSMTAIALAAGFHNVRRFNAAVRSRFDRTPTEIRKRARGGTNRDVGCVALRLAYRPPLDWTGTLRWLRPRAIPGVEEIDGLVYRRAVELGDFAGVIEVGPSPRGTSSLTVRVPVDAANHLAGITGRVRLMFDLGADSAGMSEQLSSHPRLAAAAVRFKGIRVPGCWDRFELAVRAVLGQQVSIAAASELARRLVMSFGRPLPPRYLFPRPEILAEADIVGIGLPAARAETIRRLARAIVSGAPVLDLAPDLDTAVARLTALRGIGDWTAHYIAMRALREPDAFPASDLGLRKATRGADGQMPSAAALRHLAEGWRPWRAYAAMLLWRETDRASDEEQG